MKIKLIDWLVAIALCLVLWAIFAKYAEAENLIDLGELGEHPVSNIELVEDAIPTKEGYYITYSIPCPVPVIVHEFELESRGKDFDKALKELPWERYRAKEKLKKVKKYENIRSCRDLQRVNF